MRELELGQVREVRPDVNRLRPLRKCGGVGDYALIPFGQALQGQLIGMTEGDLLALEPEQRMDGIVFRALTTPGVG